MSALETLRCLSAQRREKKTSVNTCISVITTVVAVHIFVSDIPKGHIYFRFEWLYVFGGRGRTRTDADGSGRTRTDADGRGHLIFFFAYIYLRAQLERDPESDRLGHPPPPN